MTQIRLSRRRGLLLDRDGVINHDHGYVGTRERFEFMPGLFPFLRRAQDLGFRLAVITNQSGVARGLYSESDHFALTDWMRGALQSEGISIDLALACFEYEQGTKEAYVRQSYWRKPNPGMVLEAIDRLRLDPSRSAFLGDHIRDMEAAANGGIALKLLLNGDVSKAPEGTKRVESFADALSYLGR